MQRAFTSILFSLLPLATLSCLIPLTAKAQVTTDGTTSTTVNQDGNNFTIEQGDRYLHISRLQINNAIARSKFICYLKTH